PVGGLYTGAGATKTAEQARRFGGRAGRPLDPCYHRRCDTVANVDRRVLGQNADAAAHALVVLAR
ncbi:MAG: peptidase M28, partial [Actinomycetota bacterium]|nr:peptidase M28 [Actinomycetota bacterium]